MSKNATVTISLRVSSETDNRLQKAVDEHPYKLTKTAIITRGIDLAIKELKALKLEA